MRATLLAVLVAVSIASDGAGAQERWKALVDAWFVAVTTHEPGELDDGVRTIAAWSRFDLETALPFIAALADIEAGLGVNTGRTTRRVSASDIAHLRELSLRGRRGGERHSLAIRGAFFHTDIVTLMHQDPVVVMPPRPRRPRTPARSEDSVSSVLARVPDGRFDGFERRGDHWGIARRLMSSVDPASEVNKVVTLWYRAVAAYLAHEKNFGEGLPHVQRALELFPQDTGILLAYGCLHERLASPAVQEFVRNAVLPNGAGIIGVSSARAHLDRAERAFRQGIEIEPAMVEARLRLGRVVGLDGRHEEAAAQLEQAVSEARDPVIGFYANLLLGEERMALNDLERAKFAYEKAATLYPVAQSARLALSYIARQGSDRSGALAVLAPSLAPAVRDQDDPWRSYFLGDGRRVRDLFVELYEPYRDPHER